MAIDINDFLEGLDPSVLSEVSVSQLLQMVRDAEPSGSRGLLIVDDNTPDVLTYPKFKRYSWFRPSEFNRIQRTWNDNINDWQAVGPQNNTIGTNQILDGAVTLAKLYDPGDISEAFWLIRVNASGTGFELWPLTFNNGSISIQALIKGGNNLFPHIKSDGSAWEFISADNIATLFDFGAIDVSQITSNGNIDGGIPIQNQGGNRLAILPPGSEGEILGISGGVPQYIPLPTPPVTSKFTSSLQVIPAGTGTVIVPHNLSAIPSIVDIRFVNTVAEGGYVPGDEVTIGSFYFRSGSAEGLPSICIDNTNVTVILSAATMIVVNKSSFAETPITRANWNIKIRAFL